MSVGWDPPGIRGPLGARRRGAARWSEERGAVGGWEVLPAGFLVFIVGTLVALNAWAVVDAKMRATAAAREGARAFVEAVDAVEAPARAADAAAGAMRSGGRDREYAVSVDGAFARCATVLVTVEARVSTIGLPWVTGFGGDLTTSATHAEIVDPLRSGVDGEAGSGGTVVCAPS